MEEKFTPKHIIRSPLSQTIFASLKIRNIGKNHMLECAEEVIADGGNGIRLLGYYSGQHVNKSKGVVLLIHGWEGSSDSAYIVSTGKYLYKKGFDIFRLNLRDHGESHHLNERLFNSTMIDETFTSVKNIANSYNNKPFFIAGFSLGGNFALRIALRNSKSKIANLKHITAISPVLDPMKSSMAADNVFIIRKYFVKKWKRSLLKKQALFPHVYDLSKINQYNTICEMTDVFVPKYTEFKNSKEYFEKYTLLDDALVNIKTPVTVITSADDPIIPVRDFYGLKTNKYLNIMIQSFGGHNGFIDLFPYKVWYERKIYEIFSERL